MHIFLALSTDDMPHVSGMSWIDCGLAQLALWSTLHIRFVQEACQSFGLPYGCTVSETKRNCVQCIESGSNKKAGLDTNAQMMQKHIGDFSVENDVCQLLVFNRRWSLLTGLQPDGSHIVPLVKVLGWRKSAADFATSFGLLCIDVIQLSYPEKLNFSQMAPWVVLVVDSKQQNCSDLSLKLWNWLPIELATDNLQTSQSCKSWVESLKRSVRFDLKVGGGVVFLTSSGIELPAVLLEIHSFYPGVPIGARIQFDSGMIEKVKYGSIHPRGSLASDNSCETMSGSCFPTGQVWVLVVKSWRWRMICKRWYTTQLLTG